MWRASEELLAWLFSAACLVYILRSIKQVLLPAGGFWRSPLVMFTAGALFAVVWIAIAVLCSVLFLTERCRPKSDGEEEAAGPRRTGRLPRRPFMLRRRAAPVGEAPSPQLVSTHPAAVRQGSFTGTIWLVPATLWTRNQLLSQWPPPTHGPAAIARKFHATLVGPEAEMGAALLLVPERAGGGGRNKAVRDFGGRAGETYVLLSLEGVTVDLLRDVLANRSPWATRCPLQLSHPSRPLLLGETTLFMFTESGSAKEQWYAALMAAVAPHSLLAATQHLYEDYCRHMDSLQVAQPPPMPPPQPQQPMLLLRPFMRGKTTQEQPQQVKGGKGGAPPQPLSDKKSQPAAAKDKKAQPPAGAKASADPTAARPRGGRNPFGFILSRFGRGATRRADGNSGRDGSATPTAPGSAAISRTPSLVGLSPGASPRQQSQAGMSRLQLEGDTAPQEQLPSPRMAGVASAEQLSPGPDYSDMSDIFAASTPFVAGVGGDEGNPSAAAFAAAANPATADAAAAAAAEVDDSMIATATVEAEASPPPPCPGADPASGGSPAGGGCTAGASGTEVLSTSLLQIGTTAGSTAAPPAESRLGTVEQPTPRDGTASAATAPQAMPAAVESTLVLATAPEAGPEAIHGRGADAVHAPAAPAAVPSPPPQPPLLLSHLLTALSLDDGAAPSPDQPLELPSFTAWSGPAAPGAQGPSRMAEATAVAVAAAAAVHAAAAPATPPGGSPPRPLSPTRGSLAGMSTSPAPSSLVLEQDGCPSSPTAASPCSTSPVRGGRCPATPPPPLLSSTLLQQSRHGGSMPNLVDLARRMVEEQGLEQECLRQVGVAAAAAAADPARRSLDQHVSATAPPHQKEQLQRPAGMTEQQQHAQSLPGLAGAAAEGRSGIAGGAEGQGMARSASKQDLKRLQREENERAKQEQQRAKAAARAVEEARKAEERAARERVRAEAQQRRQEEAKARQAKELARSHKQLGSTKSLQDLAAAAAPPGAPTPPPTVRVRESATAAASGAAGPAATSPPGSPQGPPPPGALHSSRSSGAGGSPEASVPLPAPPVPPPGALVDALHGLNMVLVRIGFELLRRRGFEGWLHRLIQSKLERVRGPGFLDRLVLRRFDLGCTAPQLRDVRAVAGPNNFGAGGSTWPQLALHVVWVGNANATIATKIDFDKAADKTTDTAKGPTSGAATAAGGTAPAATSAAPGRGSTAAPRAEAAPAETSAVTAGGEAAGPAVAAALAATTAATAAATAVAAVAAAVTAAAVATVATAPTGATGGHGQAAREVCPDVAAGGGGGAHKSEQGADAAAAVAAALPDVPQPGDARSSEARAAGAVQAAAPGPAAGTEVATPHQSGSGAREGAAGGESAPGLGPIGGTTSASGGGGREPEAGGAAEKGRGGGGVGNGGGGGRNGGGGKFWWNFVPFFSILRKTGQALASNIAGSLTGTPVEVHLQATRFEATLLLWLAPPPSDRLWLSFAEPPKMEFSITPVLGNRKLSGGLVIGRLSAWVRAKVTAGLARAMVYPACVDVRMGKLLLSIDSTLDAVRSFNPPSTPSPAPQWAPPPQTPPPQHTVPGGGPPPESRAGEPPSSTGPAGGYPAKPPGRPPRHPLSSASTCSTPNGTGMGAGGRSAPPVPPPPPSMSGAMGGAASGPNAFTTSALAAAAAGLAGGSSGSLIESAINHVIRRTSSILGSSPGTLSPLDGMSEAGEDEEDEGEEGEGDEADGGFGEDGGLYDSQYGADSGDGGTATASTAGRHLYGSDRAGMEGEGAPSPYWPGGVVDASAFWMPGVAPPVGSDGLWGGAAAGYDAMDTGSAPVLQLQPRHSRGSSTASLLAQQQQAAQEQYQQQQQLLLQAQGQAGGRRGGGGPFNWVRGAAGLVARGVGAVGGAGIRGLGAVGSALGQVMIGPVVHAGERAVLQQNQGAKVPPLEPQVVRAAGVSSSANGVSEIAGSGQKGSGS